MKKHSKIQTPAFWDLHLHGALGIDFMSADTEAMIYVSEQLGLQGIGYYAPTLLTDQPERLEMACAKQGRFISNVRNNPKLLPKGAAYPLGIHLEGPFLNPKMAGAHPQEELLEATPKEVLKLVESSNDTVIIVTLAPELPRAPSLISKLRSKGIRVQMGHTLATAKQALKACSHGAEGITHLYNAMGVHHRDPGVLAPLIQGLVTAEIITDGHHLSPQFVQWCWRAAGQSLYAVSDGCSAIGGRAHLRLGSLVLKKQGEVAVVAKTGTLAGGATFLTEHPAKYAALLKPAQRIEFLKLFFEVQEGIFATRLKTPKQAPNYFDSSTLRYIGRAKSP